MRWRPLSGARPGAFALKEQGRANAVTKVVENDWGKRYIIDGVERAPDGRKPIIRTVWIIEQGEDVPRLVTAHPLEMRL